MELTAWFSRINTAGDPSITNGNVDQTIDELIDRQFDLASPTENRQPDLRVLAKSGNFIRSDEEYNLLLREVAIGLVKKKLRSLTTIESEVLQMIEAMDDLDYAINLLDERLYEWSLLHRDDVARNRDLATSLAGKGPSGDLASAILDLKKSRQQIEEALGSMMSSIAPNLSSLAGPLLAARLMSRAGNLRRLSEMPSSTIQIMGAEKSLFKHLKGKAPSPKHGLIYRHPAIMNAPKRLRGRLARALSGKLAIAARIDYYSGIVSPELKRTLENRLSEIRQTGRRTRPANQVL
jgi:nucleolar protein 56